MVLVCHVITKLELGGAQEVALQVVSTLDRSSFQTVLLTGPGGILSGEATARPGVDVRFIPSLIREISPLTDLRAVIVLTRAFRRLRPSIVHTHSSKAGIIGRLAAWIAGVPVIVHTIHGYGITPRQPSWLRCCLIALEWMMGRITTAWVAVSEADLHQGLRWGLFTKETVSLIRAGIDPGPLMIARGTDRHYLRSQLGVGRSSSLIGTVACLKPQKAPEDFLTVANLVGEKFPEAHFVLAGDGELRGRIENLVKGSLVAERFHLLGWRRDIPALMNAMDVFVLTSRWEGLPCVLLEARAAAVPIVATNVGGAREAVVDGIHGWLCPAGDTAAMASRICRILEDKQRGVAWTPPSDPFPMEFTIGETVRQYQELYRRLLLRHADSFA